MTTEQIGSHKIINGNCIDVLAELEPESVDLFCTSPPYAQGLEYEDGLDWLGLNNLISNVAIRAFNICKPSCFFFVNFGETTKYENTMAELYNGAFRHAGWVMHSRRIWKKTFAQCNLTGAMTARTIPAAEWEYIWTFRKPPNSKEVHRDKTLSLRGVWETSEPNIIKRDEHPAVFPVELPQKAIRVWTDPGDVVCDPFFGSGTTGVACEREGRQCIGIEVSADYCALAKRRLELAVQGLYDPKRVTTNPDGMSSLFDLTDEA